MFGGMGKNFRVGRYAFYLFKVSSTKVRKVTLLYTSSVDLGNLSDSVKNDVVKKRCIWCKNKKCWR